MNYFVHRWGSILIRNRKEIMLFQVHLFQVVRKCILERGLADLH